MDSLPGSAPWVQADSPAQTGHTHSLEDPGPEHKPDSRTQGPPALNLRSGPGHHADATATMTRIPNPNFPPAGGGLSRSTGLALPANGLLFKLPRKSSKAQQQTIQIGRETT